MRHPSRISSRSLRHGDRYGALAALMAFVIVPLICVMVFTIEVRHTRMKRAEIRRTMEAAAKTVDQDVTRRVEAKHASDRTTRRGFSSTPAIGSAGSASLESEFGIGRPEHETVSAILRESPLTWADSGLNSLAIPNDEWSGMSLGEKWVIQGDNQLSDASRSQRPDSRSTMEPGFTHDASVDVNFGTLNGIAKPRMDWINDDARSPAARSFGSR